MTFPVFFDTCALFGGTLCDLLLRLADEEAFTPLWSDEVLGELERNLADRIGADAAARRVGAMRRAFPDAAVAGYELLIGAMTNDPKDRHVLAAAVRGHAAVIVTFNLSDFPPETTSPFDVTVVHPDAFLCNELDLHPVQVARALRGQVEDAVRPPLTLSRLLDILGRSGVPSFAAEALRHDL